MSVEFPKLGGALPKPAVPHVSAVPHAPALPTAPSVPSIDVAKVVEEAVSPSATASPSAPLPVWKADGPPSPGRSRRSLLLFVRTGLVSVVGALIGLLYWLSPPVEPAVLPLVITMESTGYTVPWMEEDRVAFSEGKWLG